VRFQRLSKGIPVYKSAVLLVKDIQKSKGFYNAILGQKIIMDFGRNVGFEGGLAIWEKEYALNLIFQEKSHNIQVGTNNCEIYFESDNLDELFTRVRKEKIKIIHPIRQHPWGQRAFRVYDPDSHIIEFAESMESVVKRLDNEGLSLEEISKKSMMPMDFITMALKQ
jgi:catechol 2,3-dioxygenase-like lactoylglutathione lyase family enzyme